MFGNKIQKKEDLPYGWLTHWKWATVVAKTRPVRVTRGGWCYAWLTRRFFKACAIARFRNQFARGQKTIGSHLKLSVFVVLRTATGSERFSYLTCLLTAIFVLLIIFSLVKTITLTIWERPLPWRTNCLFPVSVRGSKTLLAKAFYYTFTSKLLVSSVRKLLGQVLFWSGVFVSFALVFA